MHICTKNALNIKARQQFVGAHIYIFHLKLEIFTRTVQQNQYKACLITNKFISISGNQEALVNTILINNTIHVGMHSRQEHQDMLFGDMQMKLTSIGLSMLHSTRDRTKTRNCYFIALVNLLQLLIRVYIFIAGSI